MFGSVPFIAHVRLRHSIPCQFPRLCSQNLGLCRPQALICEVDSGAGVGEPFHTEP